MFVQNLHNKLASSPGLREEGKGRPGDEANNKHTGNPMEYNYDVMEYNDKHGQCLMTFINISEFHF